MEATNDSFNFEFTEFSFVDRGELTGLPELRLQGRITQGRIAFPLPIPITIPTTNGPIIASISAWMDSFDDTGLLPFYIEITPEHIPCQFCLCITGASIGVKPTCPGTAHHSP